MRVLVIDTYYPAFLNEFYAGQPTLPALPFQQQWRVLMDQCFGTADFYSSNLALLGHEATEIVANCEPLQQRWAQENGVAFPKTQSRLTLTRRRGIIPWLKRVAAQDWFYPVLKAQIAQFRPNVLYVQDMHAIEAAFLHEMRPEVRLIVGQTAYPLVPGRDYKEYDLVLTSFPHFVDRFRRDGLNSEYFRLGFDPRVLSRLREQSRHPLVFVGGLSAAHPARLRLLEGVAAAHPVDFWGYGVDLLPRDSPLRRAYHGNAWGVEMYQVLYNADMALNQHIGVADDYANNMRLYEATGVGAMLITDDKKNLRDLFEPGKEVAAYRSVDECCEMVRYYGEHAEERRTIAQAGQARTLREHTYRHRMESLITILSRALS